MLCYRCGSHVQDGAEKCWNCGTALTERRKKGTSKGNTNPPRPSRGAGPSYRVGDTVSGRYRIAGVAGTGGVGYVYRATDTRTDRDVALKIINAKLVQTADEQRLFARQIKIAQKLVHENIVRVFEEGRDEPRPFFTSEYLDGLSLRKIIDLRREKKQVFDLSEVEPIFAQLCAALDYAHKTTFHGDLKPDNVLILPDLLKVTDFALLRGLPRKPLLAIQKIRGYNFRYLAPEVRLEVPDLDKSVDIYSLGVILSEMLSGLVFDESKASLLESIELDTAVLGVVKRCVARSPKERYPSALAVHDDLKRAMARASGKSGSREAVAKGRMNDGPTQRLGVAEHSAGDDRHAPMPLVVEPDPPSSAPEGTGSVEIEDDMIEAAEMQAMRSNVTGAQTLPAEVEDSEIDEDEDKTEAMLDGSPLAVAPSVAPVGVTEPDLDEISGSAVELIADPGATDIIQTNAPAAAEPRVEAVVHDEAIHDDSDDKTEALLEHPTFSPVPLPDSSVPEPVASTSPKESAPASQAPSNGQQAAAPFSLDSPPEGDSGRPVKQRPMTRPRMSTMPVSRPRGTPVLDPASTRPRIGPATGAGPVTGAGPITGTPPVVSTLPLAAPPPVNNRPLYFTVAASVGAVILAMLIVLKVSCDRQEASERQIAVLTAQISKLQDIQRASTKRAAELEQAAKEQAGVAARAAQAEEEARAKAEEEAKRKAAAEEEARLKAEEAEREAKAAEALADDEARQEAEERAAEASRLAEEKRVAAAEAAAREEEERKRAEAERARQAEAEQKQQEAERQAQLQREAARKAASEAQKLVGRGEPVIEAASPPPRDTETSVESSEPEPAALAKPTCPRGMVLIQPGSFIMGVPADDSERNFGDQPARSVAVEAYCIDYYEYPNGLNIMPKMQVTFGAAQARCQRKGKRLCTETEWEKACKGPNGTRYPYGNLFEADRCNAKAADGTEQEVSKSGSFPRCSSGYRIFDMSGNVAEWTATPWSSGYVVKGGAADRPGYDGRCAARKKKSADTASETLGFRCCADPGEPP